jgi:hypothetical protein
MNNHPLPIHTKVITVKGEVVRDHEDELVACDSGSIGIIERIFPGPLGFVYYVEFPNRVAVFLDEVELNTPGLYEIQH